ncbi:MAG TPA: pirin family protein [bacterium]|nr:pirin family protein [bacterium]
MNQLRKISQIVQGLPTSDGAGVKIKRILGSPELNQLDPFLLLDEFKNDNPEDYAAGFPDHPHRGFETVTYMMAGAFTHRDSKGHEGHLTAGSIQWMTAGRGIIHSEMPEQADGLAWGYQLWLNLPAKLKMTDPKYQDIPPEKLPVVQKKGIHVKVLAGAYEGAKSPGLSFIPFTYLDVKLEPDTVFTLPVPQEQNAFIYVIEGKAKIDPGSEPSYVKPGFLGVLGDGDSVRLQAADSQAVHFLFASAQKLNEPVVRGGPFVMNTLSELKQAFYDYQTGRLG